ncbi:glycerophosphodiester phosphodiesterase [Alkalihalobacillus sp. LMS6]|uniref:glycerophosphodiester phosphodiesterase n=1 Tax=Bacillaceae TaxID=186817 RepID=UPI000C07164C|nr:MULTISPECIES: glycerophosphodiester phosphodiesterase family protein [Bacillaceae]UTR06824.1 glycerophosphodiester phosphodiesterase [Alkalihalobacillus sp. LMS6]
MTAIYGHRGAMGIYPENTLPSFQEALANGVEGIELDVQLTKDNQFVVLHDPTVDRTTNGTGHVNEMSLEEVKRLSAGESFTHLKKYNESWMTITIPTLEEALMMMASYQIEVNIELKPNLSEKKGVEKALLDAVQPFTNDVTINFSSFHLPLLQRMRQVNEKVELAWLVKFDVPYPVDYLNTYHIDLFHISKKIALAEHSSFEKARMLQQSRVWTVNDEEEMKALIQKGVKAIMTDYPKVALDLRKQLAL